MRPGPLLTGLTAEWYGHLRAGTVMFQRCLGCSRWRHPPRVACAGCGSAAWAWEASSRRGQIHSWTVTHQAVHPDWVADAPYAIVVAALEEAGVRLVAGWDGPLERLALDLPVTVDLIERDEGLVVPIFRS